MKKTLFGLFIALALAGCASTTPPVCDGSDRKPINTAHILQSQHQDQAEPFPVEGSGANDE